jgi:hypothetical protein
MSTVSASTNINTGYVVTADATGTLTFQTGATPATAMYIDSSQNVGIGTSSPITKFTVQTAALTDAVRWTDNINSTGILSTASGLSTMWSTAALGFGTGAVTYTERMRIDSSGNVGIGYSASPTSTTATSNFTVSGNVGIGTNSPTSTLTLSRNNVSAIGPILTLANPAGGGSNGGAVYFSVPGQTQPIQAGVYTSDDGAFASSLIFATKQTGATGNALTDRMRIDSSGNVLINKTSASTYGAIYAQTYTQNTSGQKWLQVWDSTVAAGSCQGLYVTYSAATPNGTTNEFLFCTDSTAQRFVARANGGLANYSANNVNLSDRREKTNFAPAKSYIDAICTIPVQTFNYIDQNLEEDPGLTLGVVAQDVQAVAPELVSESNWGTKEEPKMRLSIYQTDLQYALMKCIQEQQTLITALTARVEALENK